MKLIGYFFSAILLVAISLYGLSAHAAGVPTILSYQGRLADSSGNLLGSSSGTTYYFKFSLWNNATINTGTKLWPTGDPTSFASSVRQGVFNVNIGDTNNGYPDALTYNFSSSTVYLQVEVSTNGTSFETLSPRQQISSTAFAQLSGAVSGTGQSSFGTTTPVANAVVTIEATTTSAIGALIRAAIGQTASLLRIESASLGHLFSVNPSGGVFASSTVNISNPNSVAQLRLNNTSSTYGEVYTDSAGDVQLYSTGGNIRNQNENLWVCSGGSCGVDTPADKGNVIVETAIILNNKFKLRQVDASTTIMYDSIGTGILEFDEGQ